MLTMTQSLAVGDGQRMQPDQVLAQDRDSRSDQVAQRSIQDLPPDRHSCLDSVTGFDRW
jgi:hypothetical protein